MRDGLRRTASSRNPMRRRLRTPSLMTSHLNQSQSQLQSQSLNPRVVMTSNPKNTKRNLRNRKSL